MSRRARERENARPWQQERDDDLDAPDDYPDPETEDEYLPEKG